MRDTKDSQFLSAISNRESLADSLESKVRELGGWAEHDLFEYEIKQLPGGRLYSGWRTGRATNIKAEDLPESYVLCHSYKKRGYLQTAGVTDISYRPSPFHNHTFKDDFLFVKYDGKFDPPEAVITYNDSTYLFDQTGEYIFGNDIVDVVLNIEKYSPDVAEKLQEIKAAMVTQYNAWIDEMGGMFGLDESRKIRTLEELVSG